MAEKREPLKSNLALKARAFELQSFRFLITSSGWIDNLTLKICQSVVASHLMRSHGLILSMNPLSPVCLGVYEDLWGECEAPDDGPCDAGSRRVNDGWKLQPQTVTVEPDLWEPQENIGTSETDDRTQADQRHCDSRWSQCALISLTAVSSVHAAAWRHLFLSFVQVKPTLTWNILLYIWIFYFSKLFQQGKKNIFTKIHRKCPLGCL